MPSDVTPIDTVFLHVTKACNLACAYCYFSARRPLPDELSRNDFAGLWHDMTALSPKKVIFTGGEPLLRRDIFELMQGLRNADAEHHITRCLNTNGHLVTEKVVNRLIDVADEVRVSVDALGDRNDAIRGEGNFTKAMRAIDLFRNSGLEPKILVTVTRRTLPDLEGLLCVLISQGLTQININRFRPVGRGSKHHDWCVSEPEVAAAVDRVWCRLHPRSEPQSAPTVGSQQTCGVGRFLNIMPNGDVFPCHVLTQPEFRCGNLRAESLLTICARRGLLGRLTALDFDHLKQADSSLAVLAVKGVCMGEVYAQQKTSPAWNTVVGKPGACGCVPSIERDGLGS